MVLGVVSLQWQVAGTLGNHRCYPCNSSHHQLTGEPRGLCCPLATLGEEGLRAPIGLPCWLSKWNLEKEKAHQCLREAPPKVNTVRNLPTASHWPCQCCGLRGGAAPGGGGVTGASPANVQCSLKSLTFA